MSTTTKSTRVTAIVRAVVRFCIFLIFFNFVETEMKRILVDMQCASAHFYFCGCPRRTSILVFPGAVYYPKSSLLMVGGSLSVIEHWQSQPRHYAEALVGAISAGRALRSAALVKWGRVCWSLETSFVYPSEGLMEILGWTLFSCHSQALRVQRWFRRILFRMHTPRRLALAMAMHSRLGEASLLGSLLCSDVVGAIVFRL